MRIRGIGLNRAIPDTSHKITFCDTDDVPEQVSLPLSAHTDIQRDRVFVRFGPKKRTRCEAVGDSMSTAAEMKTSPGFRRRFLQKNTKQACG
jgi:hypothetical protein